MKASLQLRLSQHLALTPQLQQSIRLLQLSTLELQQEVAMAVAQNPLLENEDDWIASPLRVAADGSLITSAQYVSAPPEPMMNNGSIEQHVDVRAVGKRRTAGRRRIQRPRHGRRRGFELMESGRLRPLEHRFRRRRPPPAANPRIDHHASRSPDRATRMTQANQRDRALITFLIESLDEDGYLDVVAGGSAGGFARRTRSRRRRTECRARAAAELRSAGRRRRARHRNV